ncbi:MAG: ankyrin repeat domain-containing protein, partial [Sinomicrobium sp.]|nr:ankyrin repeat domain-containing protein [Sinomicrobium sp.]
MVVAGFFLASAAQADINDPLFEAVSSTNTSNAKPLINARLKDTLDFGPGHSLWDGAVVRSQDMFKLYMENGQDVMMNEDPDEIAGWLKLVADNLDIYDLLLQAVKNPRQLERYRAEMFQHAILEGHSPVVDLLLARGYSPEVRNDFGITPLMLAAGQGHLNIMETLLEKGVSTDSQGMTESALTLAISSGGPRAVSFLIDAGAKVNLPFASGETPL